LFALLLCAGAGAAVGGVPGALVGYVVGLLVVPFLPGMGSAACEVPRHDAPEAAAPPPADDSDRHAA
jgi:hypothetical protein